MLIKTVNRRHDGFSAFGGTINSVAVVTAALAVGALHVAGWNAGGDEMDTTDRLLSGGNRDRILAALARAEAGEVVTHELIQF